MCMKGKCIVTLALLAACHWMHGQEIRTDVKQYQLTTAGDSAVFTMRMDVTVSDMDARGSVELIPVIRSGSTEKKLAPVVLNGKKRQRLYERVQAIEMRRGIKSVPQTQIFEIEENQACPVDYRYAVPHEAWMDGAELVLQKRFIEGNGDVKSEDFVLLTPVEPTPAHSFGRPVLTQNPVVAAPVATAPAAKATSAAGLQLKGIYMAPDSDAMDLRNQKELDFDMDEARVMAQLNPQILSVRELYLVAQSYRKTELDKFYQVIETAVQVYPANPVANLNAASAAIERGEIKQAEYYLRMALHDTVAYKNCRGAYELLIGNYYEGIRLLKSAKADGSEEAAYNLKVFFESQQGKQ